LQTDQRMSCKVIVVERLTSLADDQHLRAG
jgi:hypothetical protein